ncbi:MAG: hypothetical protein AAB628_03130 [Patescibacteria group bacterium]
MINILPQSEKKKILLEYRLRLGVTVVFAIAGLVLANIALLAPSYLLVVTKYNIASEHLTGLVQAQGGSEKETEVYRKTSELNKKVSLYKGAGHENSQTPLPAILRVIEIKRPEIKINSIVYDKNSVRERIVVSGKAVDRDSLALFLETLKREPSFTKVDLPVGSYVKSVDIEFSLAVERSLKTTTTKSI